MDAGAVLDAFDRQIRRSARPERPEDRLEQSDELVRHIGGEDGWNGVIWSRLDEGNADRVIAGEVRRFAELPGQWEWKQYSYDSPPDLPERLLAAGFTAEEPEALLVAEIADLDLNVVLPDGVVLRPALDAADIDALVSVNNAVFGGDHAAYGRNLLGRLTKQPASLSCVIAWAGEFAICSGRVEFAEGTEFASIWGGGTLPAWRGRGVFRAVVAHRAALAAARGFRYLQVDASGESQPILERLGFVRLATTTPFNGPSPSAKQEGREGD
jgi:ribosomal protein S18 acetylase RimI-like enzyme